MRGPYAYSDGKSEYWRWFCGCGFTCERFKWEYNLGTVNKAVSEGRRAK